MSVRKPTHLNVLRALALTLAAVSFLASACGGGSDQPAGSTKVTMSDYKFDPAQINVKSGKVQFYLVNSGGQPHDMVLQDSSGKTLGKSSLVQAGNSDTFTVDNLPAGSFDFFCDVAGHKEQGMVGKLSAT